MFLATRPTRPAIDRFLDESRSLPLSYSPTGLAQASPAGYQVDELVVTIGRGPADFERAKAALAAWKHFDIPWLSLFPTAAFPEAGSVVAILVRHLGFWSLNAARVVYGIGDREDGTRFGFAYGTLANHAEAGEELFEVFVDQESEDVMYRIRAASRPRAALARLGYPIVRRLQARFRRDSAIAMTRAVSGGG